MWMAKKGLFELLEEDRGAFEATLQVAPMLLQDLFPHDGMDAAGEQTGQILPGATISLEDVQAVHRGSNMYNEDLIQHPSGIFDLRARCAAITFDNAGAVGPSARRALSASIHLQLQSLTTVP